MVELTVVEEDVRVGVGGDGEGALADSLAASNFAMHKVSRS